MQWVEMENPEGKKIPKWQRSAGITDEGVVFIPCAIAGDEKNILLCAAYDGTPTVEHLKHLYMPANWLAKEFPGAKEVCELIEFRIKEIVASEIGE